MNAFFTSDLSNWTANKTNSTDTEALFLDLHLSISNSFVSSKIYDKHDDYILTLLISRFSVVVFFFFIAAFLMCLLMVLTVLSLFGLQ